METTKTDPLKDAMQNNLMIMQAWATKSIQLQRKVKELEDDMVRIMDVQTQLQDRLSIIETTYHNAGISGFKTPWYKRAFKIKDHLSHLDKKKEVANEPTTTA